MRAAHGATDGTPRDARLARGRSDGRYSSSFDPLYAVSLFGERRHAPLPAEGRLPGFAGAAGWLNSEPLTAEGLRGKIVLVDFWTYTCINWLRTLAYVRAWAARYKHPGLVVVGVHTPEFPFEADIDNVRRAVEDMSVWVSDCTRPGPRGLARVQ